MRSLFYLRQLTAGVLPAFKNGNFYQPHLKPHRMHAKSCAFSTSLTPKLTFKNSHFDCLWPANLPPATDWGYTASKGPHTWPQLYPDAGGKHQSPIDIVTSLVSTSNTIEQTLNWKYEGELGKSMINTGCGWRVDVAGGQSVLFGGPLSHKYELVQFHGHWGDAGCNGSEHTINGSSFSGELHFVHWNTDLYETCAEACHSPDGLTVIGVFLEVGDANSEIEKLCEVLNQIPVKDERVDVPADINPVAMYPSNYDYWTYKGSLTTPPCFETVTWIVFKNPISVSEDQFNCFRRMQSACKCGIDEAENLVTKNYRPPQPLNDRQIWECSC